MSESQQSTCECKAEDIILLPCSGGSNCGQIANQAAVSLDTMGIGRIYCLAGIGAHIDGMVESAKSAKRLVALDGCQVACARKTIEHTGLAVTDWICVTDEGISKSHNLLLEQTDIDFITQRAKESLAKPLEVK
ncbi:MAG: putative zinc-binding protein [Dehalococcoidales bacterium]|nr:putative zinc-binding protein [Dehalococcoidales bacterium]